MVQATACLFFVLHEFLYFLLLATALYGRSWDATLLMYMLNSVIANICVLYVFLVSWKGTEIDTFYSNALKPTLFEVTTVWLTIFKLYAFRSCSCSTVNLCPMSFLDYLWKVSSSFVVVQDAFICPCSAK